MNAPAKAKRMLIHIENSGGLSLSHRHHGGIQFKILKHRCKRVSCRGSSFSSSIPSVRWMGGSPSSTATAVSSTSCCPSGSALVAVTISTSQQRPSSDGKMFHERKVFRPSDMGDQQLLAFGECPAEVKSESEQVSLRSAQVRLCHRRDASETHTAIRAAETNKVTACRGISKLVFIVFSVLFPFRRVSAFDITLHDHECLLHRCFIARSARLGSNVMVQTDATRRLTLELLLTRWLLVPGL